MILRTRTATNNINHQLRKEVSMVYKLARRSLFKKNVNEPQCTCSLCESGINKPQIRWTPWISIFILLLVLVVMCLMAGCAQAYTVKDEIKAVIGESEGEPFQGKVAVACAIHFRGTLHGVYGLHAPRVVHHKYSQKTYKDAVKAVEMSQDQDYCQGLISGAQYWEGTKFPLPYWAKSMTVTAVIGNQKFFRE